MACLHDQRDMGRRRGPTLCQAREGGVAGPAPTAGLVGSPLVLGAGGILAVVRTSPRLLTTSVALAGLIPAAAAVPFLLA